MMGKLSREISEALRRDDFERMPNHENTIRNILLKKYLDDDDRRVSCSMGDHRFMPEILEHYDGQGSYMGGARFVSRKYSAYYGKGIMLGFVVSQINIAQNAQEIESLQNESARPSMHGNFAALDIRASQETYRCIYQIQDGELELRHTFVDFSGVVR